MIITGLRPFDTGAAGGAWANAEIENRTRRTKNPTLDCLVILQLDAPKIEKFLKKGRLLK
jgi:hypothetical protein